MRDSKYQGIDILPDDIFGDILMLVSRFEQDELCFANWSQAYEEMVARPNDLANNFGLGQVASRWRATCLGRRVFWVNLYISWRSNLGKAFAVLAFLPDTIGLYFDIDPILSHAEEPGAHFASPELLEQVLHSIAARSRQVRGIVASVDPDAPAAGTLFNSGLAYPQLQALVFVKSPMHFNLDIDIKVERLRFVDVDRVNARNGWWQQILTPHLQTLRFTSLDGQGHVDSQYLQDIFSRCPNLECLDFGAYYARMSGDENIAPGSWSGHHLTRLSIQQPLRQTLAILRALAPLSSLREVYLVILRQQVDDDSDTDSEDEDNGVVDGQLNPIPFLEIVVTGPNIVTQFEIDHQSFHIATHDGKQMSAHFSSARMGYSWDIVAIWRYLCFNLEAHRTIPSLRISDKNWANMARAFDVMPPAYADGLVLLVEQSSQGRRPTSKKSGSSNPSLRLPTLKRVIFRPHTSDIPRKRQVIDLMKYFHDKISVPDLPREAPIELCFCGWRKLYSNRTDLWENDLELVLQLVSENQQEHLWRLCLESLALITTACEATS